MPNPMDQTGMEGEVFSRDWSILTVIKTNVERYKMLQSPVDRYKFLISSSVYSEIIGELLSINPNVRRASRTVCQRLVVMVTHLAMTS